MQCVYRNYYIADVVYRRALGLDGHHPAVIDNYEFFLENRRPGGLYPGPSPGKLVQWRAKPVHPDLKVRCWSVVLCMNDAHLSHECLVWWHCGRHRVQRKH